MDTEDEENHKIWIDYEEWVFWEYWMGKITKEEIPENIRERIVSKTETDGK